MARFALGLALTLLFACAATPARCADSPTSGDGADPTLENKWDAEVDEMPDDKLFDHMNTLLEKANEPGLSGEEQLLRMDRAMHAAEEYQYRQDGDMPPEDDDDAAAAKKKEAETDAKIAPVADKVLQRQPNNIPANQFKAGQEMAKNPKAAVNRLEKIDKLKPGDAKTKAQLGAGYAALGDRAASLAAWKEAARLDPKNKMALAMVKLGEHAAPRKAAAPTFDSLKSPEPGPNAKPERRDGPKIKTAENRAPEPAKEALHMSDPKADGKFQEARSRMGIGDYARAAALAGQSIESGSHVSESRLLRSKALHAQGDYRAAIEDDDAVLDAEGEAALDALLAKTMAEINEGALNEAKQDSKAASRIAPKKRELEELIEDAGAPLKNGPGSSTQPGPAVAAASSTATLRLPAVPDSAPGISPESLAYTRRAAARLTLGDAPDALRLCAAALKIDPGNYYAYLVEAAAYGALGQYKKSIEAATTALKMQPLIASALLTRGMSYLKLEDWRQAEADASAVLRLNPESVEAYALRAEARRRMGDSDGARADLQRARELSGDAAEPARRPRSGMVIALMAGGGAVALGAALSALRKTGPQNT